MAGEAYVKRYPGGFQDLPSKTTAEDSQFLNAVEGALLRLLGADPTDGAVQTWDAALARFKTALITNAQLSPSAGVTRSKLDLGAGLVDADIAPGAAISSSKISGLTGTAPPTGAMMLYGGTVAPTGWLLCDGSAISRTTQAGIFSVIGTAYGAGDGSTTFNLPDFRGRVPVAVGTHADVGSLGANDGAAVADRRPKHAHSHTLGTGTDTPDHTHAFDGGDYVGAGQPARLYTAVGTGSGANSTGASARHTHAITGGIGQAGMTDSVAYLAINMIMKT